jgi:hypothetical protein
VSEFISDGLFFSCNGINEMTVVREQEAVDQEEHHLPPVCCEEDVVEGMPADSLQPQDPPALALAQVPPQVGSP